MKPINIHLRTFVGIVALLISVGMNGQESIFQKFQSAPNLNLKITADWDTIRNLHGEDEKKAKTEFDGEIWKSEIRLRGRNRRVKCDSTLMPLRLQFKKKELRKAGFEEFRNHKIVTCCLESDKGLENLQEELLVYQLYEILTDQSYQSVPAQLVMSWPKDANPEKTTSVLIMEPTKELAHRIGGTEVEAYNHPADSLDSESYNRAALFNFMIGNFDWSHAMQTNVKMIRVNAKAVIVPYDFDFSAIVSPSYARIPTDLGLKDFKDRIYRGQFFIEALPDMEQQFILKKEELYTHVLNYEGLKKFRRKQINKYLDIFFDFIDDPDHNLTENTILPFN